MLLAEEAREIRVLTIRPISAMPNERLCSPCCRRLRDWGRPLKWPRRLMVEAIFYLVRSGCAWRMRPRHFPPWQTVHSQRMRWPRDGTLRRMHDRLRELVREAEGREPSSVVIDSQTARASGAGGPVRGFDAGKKVFGRKRHILVDAAGLILLMHVHAANLHDTLGARQTRRRGPSSAGTRLGRRRLRWTLCEMAGSRTGLAGGDSFPPPAPSMAL